MNKPRIRPFLTVISILSVLAGMMLNAQYSPEVKYYNGVWSLIIHDPEFMSVTFSDKGIVFFKE